MSDMEPMADIEPITDTDSRPTSVFGDGPRPQAVPHDFPRDDVDRDVWRVVVAGERAGSVLRVTLASGNVAWRACDHAGAPLPDGVHLTRMDARFAVARSERARMLWAAWEARPWVRIGKVGSLPSCIAWYALGVDGSGPYSGSRSRTRAEARKWAEANGYRWKR